MSVNNYMRKRSRKYWIKKLVDKDGNLLPSIAEKVAPIEGAEELLNAILTPFMELGQADDKLLAELKGDYYRSFSFYSSATNARGQTAYLESDIEDDSQGLKPKFIKFYLESFGLKGFSALVWTLNYYIQENPSRIIDSDGAVDMAVLEGLIFNKKWFEDENVDSLFKGMEKNVEAYFLFVLNRLFNVNVRFSQKAIAFLLENTFVLPAVLSCITKNEFSKFGYKNLVEILDERANIWKKKTGRVPSSIAMLFVHPNRFDPKVLGAIEIKFGTKQIHSLPKIEQWKAATIIDCFGSSLSVIPKGILENGYLSDYILGVSHKSDLNITEKDINTSLEIMNSLNTKDGISLPFLAKNVSIIAKLPENFFARIKEMGNGSMMEDITSLFASIAQNGGISEDEINFALSFKPRWFATLKRYYNRPVDVPMIKALYEIWDSRSETQNVPFEGISGEIDGYTYHMLDKTKDMLGLFVGNMTDCCQVFDGAGRTCLRNGYLDENQTFFVVEKKGKVVAQSWVWLNNGVLCFDSIECLGKFSSSNSDTILSCYIQAARQLVEGNFGIYYVTAGGDGSNIPEDLKDVSTACWDQDDIDLPSCVKDDGCYSDAKSTQYVLYERVAYDD